MSGIEITAVRRGSSLVPTSEQFEQDILEIAEGREVFVTIRMARNPAQHRWFFGVLHKMIEGGVWEGDVESLLDHIKIAVGHVSKVIHWTGEVYYSIRSIAFASMDQLKFQRFVRRAEYVIAERFGVDVGSLFRSEVNPPPIEEDPRKEPADEPETEPAGMDRVASFEAPSWDRMAGLAMKMLRASTLPGVKEVYINNEAEFQVLVQIDRMAMSDVYQIAQRKAKGEIDKATAERLINDRIDLHKQETEGRT